MPASEQAALQPSVLLVDDTGTNLIVLSAVLSPLKVRLVEALSGEEALRRVQEEAFAVAILDVQMPGMDGFELARRMRELDKGREVPIIFVTAIHRDEAFVRRGYAVGAADYVTKPFDVEVLRARVRAFVELFQQREQVRRVQLMLRTRERDEALRRVAAFERIAVAVFDSNDLEALLRELLGIFLEGTETASFAHVLMGGPTGLDLIASAMRPGMDEQRLPSPVDEPSFEAQVARTGRALEIQRGDEREIRRDDWLNAHNAGALFGVPLWHDTELLGVAYTGTAAGPLPERERALFVAVAERVAWAMGKHLRQARLRSILGAAPAIIAMFRGPEHSAEFLNQAGERFFGGPSYAGKTVRELGFSKIVENIMDEVRSSGHEASCEELPVSLRRDVQQTGFVNLTVQPLRGPSGVVDGVIMFAVDVTGQVRARQEVESYQAERTALLEREQAARYEAELANHAKDEFLATLSHELRTPLNAVLGWTARARTKSGEQLTRALDIVERNAAAQARMVDDMLDLSRIINGQLRLEFGVVDVLEPVRGAVEGARPTAEAKGVGLSLALEPGLEVHGDADRLQQIIWNLVSNAIKFTPTGGQVSVAARDEGDSVGIAVRDSGQGISAEFLPNVFTPFRQADGSSARRHGGLGLGLAIAKQLAEAHRGRLFAQSEGKGRGSTFSLVLPKWRGSKADADRSSRRSAVLASEARLDHVRVLVVDDEADSRTMVSEMLEESGAKVRAVGSVAEALGVFDSVQPDLVISDIAMPGADGYQLMREIRALSDDRGRSTKAIALSAYARREDVERALQAGFQQHMSKPVNLDKLLAEVVALLGIEGAARAGSRTTLDKHLQ